MSVQTIVEEATSKAKTDPELPVPETFANIYANTPGHRAEGQMPSPIILSLSLKSKSNLPGSACINLKCVQTVHVLKNGGRYILSLWLYIRITIPSFSQGRIQDFIWGGGAKDYVPARTLQARNRTINFPGRGPGRQGPLKGLGSSRVVLMLSRAISALFLSILRKK